MSTLIRKNNLNHVRMKKILGKLVSSELIMEFNNGYVITEKGRLALDSWKRFHNLTQSFGLEL